MARYITTTLPYVNADPHIEFALVTKGDEYMTEHEPYKKIKDETTAEAAREALRHLVGELARVALYLAPFLPATSAHILEAVHANKKPENLFPRLAA